MYDKKEIRRQIFYLMIPIILENFLQLCTNLIATAMVGRLTEIDISAQGMSSKIIDIAYFLIKGAGTALVILTAKKFAHDNFGACRTIFERTSLSVVIIGLALGTFIFLKPEFWLGLFTSDEALIEHAVGYIRILVLCLPFWGVMIMVSSVFQGRGDTRTPMFMAAGVNVINVFLCYGLIFGNFGLPELGYRGAAISLVISRTIGCIVAVVLLYNQRVGLFTLSLKKEPVPNVIREVYSIGLPTSGEAIVWQLAAILLARVILSYGQQAFAAYQLGVQAEIITEIPAIGFSIAATSLISKLIALKDEAMFRICKRELIKICIAISAVTSSLLMFLPNGFMYILTDNDELAKVAIPYVVIMGAIQIPQNLIKVYSGILRSANYKTTPLKIQFIGTWGVRIPLSLLCAYVLKLPLISIWFCIAADQTVKFLILKTVADRKKIDFD